MRASELVLAARNLWRHRTRTVISLCAIAFGVVALLLAGGFIEWIFWAMRESSIQTGLGHIQIVKRGFREAGTADPKAFLLPANAPELNAIRSAPGVTQVGQRIQITGLAAHEDTTGVFTGEAVDPDADKALSHELRVEGAGLDARDPSGVIIGSGLATALGVKPGDAITFLVNVPRSGLNAVDAHVLGLFTTQIKAYDDSAVRMPLALGRKLLKVDGAHVWVVGLDATEHTDSALGYLRTRLSPDRFQLASWFELSDFYRKAVVLLSQQVYAVAALIAVIIVLGITNTLTMNVLERTGEIGTLMALGTRRPAILRLFVTEGVLLGVVGGVVGLVAGIALAALLSWIGIPMPPPPGRTEGYSAQIMLTAPLTVGALVLAIVATAIASLYPAWKASRLPIVDALRHNR